MQKCSFSAYNYDVQSKAEETDDWSGEDVTKYFNLALGDRPYIILSEPNPENASYDKRPKKVMEAFTELSIRFWQVGDKASYSAPTSSSVDGVYCLLQSNRNTVKLIRKLRAQPGWWRDQYTLCRAGRRSLSIKLCTTINLRESFLWIK